MPFDLDAIGNPIAIRARERVAFTADQAYYDKLDNIAYTKLMQSCRLRLEAKHTACDLLQRLEDHYSKLYEVAKSNHALPLLVASIRKQDWCTLSRSRAA